jgi:hypothetical protein
MVPRLHQKQSKSSPATSWAQPHLHIRGSSRRRGLWPAARGRGGTHRDPSRHAAHARTRIAVAAPLHPAGPTPPQPRLVHWQKGAYPGSAPQIMATIGQDLNPSLRWTSRPPGCALLEAVCEPKAQILRVSAAAAPRLRAGEHADRPAFLSLHPGRPLGWPVLQRCLALSTRIELQLRAALRLACPWMGLTSSPCSRTCSAPGRACHRDGARARVGAAIYMGPGARRRNKGMEKEVGRRRKGKRVGRED